MIRVGATATNENAFATAMVDDDDGWEGWDRRAATKNATEDGGRRIIFEREIYYTFLFCA